MMTRDEWDSLTASSGWPKLKQYLRDARERRKEVIAGGSIRGDKLTEAILQCQVLKDVAEMDFDTIQQFYEEPDESRQTTEPAERE